jgi:hypothetical protein
VAILADARLEDGAEIGRFYSNPESKRRALRYARAACSPDGRMLALAEPESPTIRVFEIASGKVRLELAGGHRHGVHALAFSPDSRTLGNFRSTVATWSWGRAACPLPSQSPCRRTRTTADINVSACYGRKRAVPLV